MAKSKSSETAKDEQITTDSPAISNESKTIVLKTKIDNSYDLDSVLATLLTSSTDIINGYPTEHGLRKLAIEHIGKIVSRETTIKDCNPVENFASVTVRFTFKDKDGDFITYEGTGESNQNNLKEPYNKFALAVAETRASSRALRAALNIKTCSYDELAEEDKKEVKQQKPQSYILNIVRSTASKKGINLTDYLKQNYNSEILDNLDIQSVQKILNYLNGV
jgi:hypothetical protein